MGVVFGAIAPQNSRSNQSQVRALHRSKRRLRAQLYFRDILAHLYVNERETPALALDASATGKSKASKINTPGSHFASTTSQIRIIAHF